jgi:F0F1-type ATP synthase membrane subunit b/b'
LNRRVQEFLVQADASERNSLEQSRSQYMSILANAKEQQQKQRPDKVAGTEKTLKEYIKDGCAAVTETAYEYTQMLDDMVGQAPEYVALAYGAIKIFLVV